MEWLSKIYLFVEADEQDEAIDVLFHHIDDMLYKNQLKECDDVLRAIDLSKLDIDLLVALLSITKSPAGALPYREELVSKIREQLQYLAPDRVDQLLAFLI